MLKLVNPYIANKVNLMGVDMSNKWLLFSSVGPREGQDSVAIWSQGKDRYFDMVLYYYKGDIPESSPAKCVWRTDFKYPNFAHFLENNDVSQYEAIWVVDDDIVMTTDEINRMFAIFSEQGLWLAQPACDENSHITVPITRRQPEYAVRHVNVIENGTTIYSRHIIDKCLPVFKAAQSGWGVGIIVSQIINAPYGKIGVIDQTPCHHPEGKSALDEVMPRPDHQVEGEALMKKFGVWYIRAEQFPSSIKNIEFETQEQNDEKEICL